jgi:hypothetical protein
MNVTISEWKEGTEQSAVSPHSYGGDTQTGRPPMSRAVPIYYKSFTKQYYKYLEVNMKI